MAILNIQTSVTGLSGTLPGIIYIMTDETVSSVVNNPGFLNAYVNEISIYDSALVYTTDEGAVLLKVVYNSDNNIGLAAQTAGGVVTVPTITGHIAVYDNTNGGQYQDYNPAINAGSIQAGVNGTPGAFISYPSSSNSGTVTLRAENNSGNHHIEIINNSHSQDTTYYLQDPQQSGAYFITSEATGTQALNSGSFQVVKGNATFGSSGNQSVLTVYPASANSGSFIIQSTSNISGNFSTTITNDPAIGQSQVVKIPDAGTTTSNFIISNHNGVQAIATGSLQVLDGSFGVGSNTDTVSNLRYFSIFPDSANKGSLVFSANSNAGNYVVHVQNDSFGQSSALMIPDVQNANGSIVTAAGTAPFADGHALVANGTQGLIKDAGYSMSFGSSTAPGVANIVPFLTAGVTSSSKVIITQTLLTDPAAVLLSVAAGTNSITCTYSAPPGLVDINYIYFN